MIYLFDKNENLIKLVKKDAIKSALQKFTLTTEKYVSDRLTVEMKDLTAQELEQVEYMAIQSIDDAHKFHFFYIAQKISNQTLTLIGVQSGIEELRKSVVLDKRPKNSLARPVIDDLLQGTNWQARFVSETSQRSTNFYYISTFEALKKVCQVWNLEMQFFIEMNGNKIGARYIDFKQKIGEATGKRVVYGHNALQILQEVERTNLFTALIGRGKGEEVSAPTGEGGQAGYGRRITFEDIIWEKAKGAPVDKPKGQKYVELPEMTKKYGIKNADGTMRAKVGFAVFEQEEDANVLIRRTYEQLVNAARPQLTLKTSTVYLKNVNIGDTIRVVRHDKKLDYDTRIFEITFNRLNNESSDIKLGDRISESNEAKIQNIASQKADELISSSFNGLLKNLPDFLPTPNGLNRNWYGSNDPTKAHAGKVGINDIWFKPNPEHEGQTIMLRWTGEVWEEVIRSNTDEEIIDEIGKRFENLNLSGVDEAKAKAEEALKKAGTSADLVEQIKGLVDTTRQNLDNFKNQANVQFITESQFNYQLSSAQTELKKYVKEETDEKTSAIRETLSRDYVAKSTFTENVEGTNQRFEALKRDNEAKLAEYKQGIDGRFTSITSLVAGKADQIEFQRVKETAQLYERILGSSESDISRNASRLVMSDQVFQTEVGKYVTDDNNLIVNSLTMSTNTIVNASRQGVEVFVNDGVFSIKAQGLTSYNFSGFTLPIYVKKIYRGETYTLGFKYRILSKLDSVFAFNVKNHKLNKLLLNADIGTPNSQVSEEWYEFQRTFTVQEDFAFGEDESYPFYIYLAKNGWIEFKEPILVRGSRTGTYKPSQFDDAYKQTKEAKELAENAQIQAIKVAEKAEEAKKTSEATRAQMTLLSNSWSVRTLNSASDVLGAINLNPDGSVKINEGLISVGEKTYIKNGVIKSGMIGNAQIGTAHIGEIDASQARIINISSKNIVTDGLTANIIKGGKLSSLNSATNFDLQTGWIEMNREGVGVVNHFAGRPIQYLVFGAGAISDKPGSYTALMSNSNGRINMDDGSAGIQIWNTNDNTTAVNLYGDEIAMMYNANDPKGIIFDNIKNEIRNVETLNINNTIWIKGTNLVQLFDLINKNFEGIERHFQINKLGRPGRYKVSI
jgi:phage minor structural protein, N-terminal domain protein|nr:MAG TPA: minor structural protein [Caudoviricetes sp.]